MKQKLLFPVLVLVRFIISSAFYRTLFYVVFDLLNKVFPMLVFILLIRGVAFLISFDIEKQHESSLTPTIVLSGICILILLQPTVKIFSELLHRSLTVSLIERYVTVLFEKRYHEYQTPKRLKPDLLKPTSIDDYQKLIDSVIVLLPTAALIIICTLVLSVFLSVAFSITVLLAIIFAFIVQSFSNGMKGGDKRVRVLDARKKQKWIMKINAKVATKTKREFSKHENVEAYVNNPKWNRIVMTSTFNDNIPFVLAAVILIALVLQFAFFAQQAADETTVNLLSFIVVIRFFVNYLRLGYIQTARMKSELERQRVNLDSLK